MNELPQPQQGARGRRVGLSIAATLKGWASAAAVTGLAFVLPELWRNTLAPERAWVLGEGASLWCAFTFAVCAAVWAVVMLPVALWVPPGVLLRVGRALPATCSLAGVLLVGWRLDVWHTLRENPAESPLRSLMLWNYMMFAAVFAVVTARAYMRVLAGGGSANGSRDGVYPEPAGQAGED